MLLFALSGAKGSCPSLYDFDLPAFTPAGHYTVEVRFMDADDHVLLCVHIEATISVNLDLVDLQRPAINLGLIADINSRKDVGWVAGQSD